MSHLDKSLLYSSFNARALNPAEVAQTFIPPPEFFRLANKSHTFIVGPRGSGKTTLLKMLQQPAIEAWSHPEADRLRESIAFTGVFIPTDVTLASQLEAAVINQAHGDLVIRAAYAIHVLRALMSSIEYRAGRVHSIVKRQVNRVEISHEMERSLVAEIVHALGRTPKTLSFASLRTDLSAWLSEIFQFATRQSLLPEDKQNVALAGSRLLHLDIVRTASIAIDAFESVTGKRGERWALLCDELELAPDVIVSELLRLVRSTDQRILFKLSLSPYVAGDSDFNKALLSFNTPSGDYDENEGKPRFPAQENEDFDTIRLWYPNKKEGTKFARELAESVALNKGIKNPDIDEILGRSVFDAPKPQDGRRSAEAYSPGSARNARMKRLAQLDPTFKEYLFQKGINLDAEIKNDDMRAKTLRKINSIVIVREAFRKLDVARSRKNPTLYSGASSFFAICESNPRFLIGMLNQLLGGEELSSPQLRVEASKQAAVYAAATARFRAYLRTIPSPPLDGAQSRGLLVLIEYIGMHFNRETVVGPFDDDADGSFIVDSNSTQGLCDAIQRALNSGAVIWVPEKEDESLLTSVRGKRFRLSYLLAPHFQLPLHLGRPVSLGKILKLRNTRGSNKPGINKSGSSLLFDIDGDDQ